MPSNPVVIAVLKAKKMIEPKSGDESVNGCPVATQDIRVNLSNRYKAVQAANYGPLNPELPNTKYWEAKAKQFKATVEEAKTTLCGNCSFFIQTPDIMACIEKGIGDELDSYSSDIVKVSNLGYCELFDFKCAGDRTCDAWLMGGPITTEDVEDGETE
jgi:hypothetical protein